MVRLFIDVTDNSSDPQRNCSIYLTYFLKFVSIVFHFILSHLFVNYRHYIDYLFLLFVYAFLACLSFLHCIRKEMLVLILF